MTISTLFVLAVSLTLLLLRWILRPRPLRHIRGPSSPSFIFGHEHQFHHRDEVGELESGWIGQYGTAWRTKGCLGEDSLMLADPKALQYIFHTSGYHFPKRFDAIQSTRLITGRGILWASGDTHSRHRKIMSPAFAPIHLKSFLASFRASASRLSQKWKDELQSPNSKGQETLNVVTWLSRMTLDVIGEVAFDYHFGSLENSQDEFCRAVNNLFIDSFLKPSKFDILFWSLWRYIPLSILSYLECVPTRKYRRYRGFLQTSKRIARKLLAQNQHDPSQHGSRDIMSILARSNMAEHEKDKLDDDEVLSQMSTVMLAGHDSTANSISWLLLELARHPLDQERIRDEIAAARVKITERGDVDFSISDLDDMVFLNAALKEGLRFHPIVPLLVRQSDRADVIPLSTPIMTTSGQYTSEIPIPKGQSLQILVSSYNRLCSVWGPDAGEWNPHRFLEDSLRTEKDAQHFVGTFANLMTFSAGIRGCIGWRFAVIEMQAVIVELLENFDFREAENVTIQRVPSGLMMPMVKGDALGGKQLPLKVSLR